LPYWYIPSHIGGKRTVKKVERRIVAISRAFLVSLPIEFLREHGLGKGSVVTLYYNGDVVIEAGSGEPVDASRRRSSHGLETGRQRPVVERKTERARASQAVVEQRR
jgi:hypothetical protein